MCHTTLTNSDMHTDSECTGFMHLSQEFIVLLKTYEEVKNTHSGITSLVSMWTRSISQRAIKILVGYYL